MPSNRVMTIGSALIDVFITSDAFKLDVEMGVLTCGTKAGKLEVDSFDIRTGGGAANTAVGFQRMGFEAVCLAELGRDDQAQLVIDELAREGVDISLLVKEKKEKTGGSVIMVTETGERMVLVHRGAASMLDPHDIVESTLAEASWIHLSSIGAQFETLRHIFALVAQNHTRLSWNPGSKVLRSLSEQDWPIESFPVELLILNKEEWELVQPVQARLKATIPQIIVTDGSRGGQVLIGGQLHHEYQSEAVIAIDNTGAGDAFVVGYVSALLQGKDAKIAAAWGARNAASVVQRIGAKPGLLYATDIEK